MTWRDVTYTSIWPCPMSCVRFSPLITRSYGVDKFVLLRVGPFPDIYSNLALGMWFIRFESVFTFILLRPLQYCIWFLFTLKKEKDNVTWALRILADFLLTTWSIVSLFCQVMPKRVMNHLRLSLQRPPTVKFLDLLPIFCFIRLFWIASPIAQRRQEMPLECACECLSQVLDWVWKSFVK